MAYNKSSIWHKRKIIMLWEHYYNDLTLDDFIKFYKKVQIKDQQIHAKKKTNTFTCNNKRKVDTSLLTKTRN